MRQEKGSIVIPVKTGIQSLVVSVGYLPRIFVGKLHLWFPAFAGMTRLSEVAM